MGYGGHASTFFGGLSASLHPSMFSLRSEALITGSILHVPSLSLPQAASSIQALPNRRSYRQPRSESCCKGNLQRSLKDPRPVLTSRVHHHRSHEPGTCMVASCGTSADTPQHRLVSTMHAESKSPTWHRKLPLGVIHAGLSRF